MKPGLGFTVGKIALEQRERFVGWDGVSAVLHVGWVGGCHFLFCWRDNVGYEQGWVKIEEEGEVEGRDGAELVLKYQRLGKEERREDVYESTLEYICLGIRCPNNRSAKAWS